MHMRVVDLEMHVVDLVWVAPAVSCIRQTVHDSTQEHSSQNYSIRTKAIGCWTEPRQTYVGSLRECTWRQQWLSWRKRDLIAHKDIAERIAAQEQLTVVLRSRLLCPCVLSGAVFLAKAYKDTKVYMWLTWL